MSIKADAVKLFKLRIHERMRVLYIRRMIGENFPYLNKKIVEVYNAQNQVVKQNISSSCDKREFKADVRIVLEDGKEAYLEIVHKNPLSKSKEDFYVTNKINSFILEVPYESIFEEVSDEELLSVMKRYSHYSPVGEEGAFNISLDDKIYPIKEFLDTTHSIRFDIDNETYFILKEKPSEKELAFYRKYGNVYVFKKYNIRASLGENIKRKNFKAVKC